MCLWWVIKKEGGHWEQNPVREKNQELKKKHDTELLAELLATVTRKFIILLVNNEYLIDKMKT